MQFGDLYDGQYKLAKASTAAPCQRSLLQAAPARADTAAQDSSTEASGSMPCVTASKRHCAALFSASPGAVNALTACPGSKQSL